MTTIAYRDGIIAVDSRSTANGTITNDDTNKIEERDGVLFFCTGHASDQREIVEAYFSDPYNEKAVISALVIDDGIVYLAGVDKNDGFWKLDITGIAYSIGSGCDHALTAMDLGCDAKKAVKMAMKRDVNTGGKIRTRKTGE